MVIKPEIRVDRGSPGLDGEGQYLIAHFNPAPAAALLPAEVLACPFPRLSRAGPARDLRKPPEAVGDRGRLREEAPGSDCPCGGPARPHLGRRDPAPRPPCACGGPAPPLRPAGAKVLEGAAAGAAGRR